MADPNSVVRSRIAPTPSGYLHFGNVLSFVFTALLTRAHGGELRLRIDDLDRSRYRVEYLEDIFRLLDMLGLNLDEEPSGVADFLSNHSQLLRLEAYAELLNDLRATEQLYACNCSRKTFSELPQGSTCLCASEQHSFNDVEVVWRLNALPEQGVARDLDGVEHHVSLRTDPGFIPLRQRDGSPSYQIASLCDDVKYGVNLIVRGEDLIPSSALQLHLSGLLGTEVFQSTRFFHHRLLLQHGQKMSKSAGSAKRSLQDDGLSAASCYREIANIIGVDGMQIKDFNSLYAHLEGSLIEQLRTAINPPYKSS